MQAIQVLVALSSPKPELQERQNPLVALQERQVVQFWHVPFPVGLKVSTGHESQVKLVALGWNPGSQLVH